MQLKTYRPRGTGIVNLRRSNRALMFFMGSCLASAFTFATGYAGEAIDPNEISQEHTVTTSRIRISPTYFRFTMADKHFSGYGPDFAFEKSLSPHWNVGGAIGQAYSVGDQLGTLFVSLDISLWYSLWGSFTQERHVWKNKGTAIAEYTNERTGGLRIGLGTEQYFFNTSKGAIPFSGLAAKVFYEFGLPYTFDLGAGIESASLANSADKAGLIRAFASFILPLN